MPFVWAVQCDAARDSQLISSIAKEFAGTWLQRYFLPQSGVHWRWHYVGFSSSVKLKAYCIACADCYIGVCCVWAVIALGDGIDEYWYVIIIVFSIDSVNGFGTKVLCQADPGLVIQFLAVRAFLSKGWAFLSSMLPTAVSAVGDICVALFWLVSSVESASLLVPWSAFCDAIDAVSCSGNGGHEFEALLCSFMHDCDVDGYFHG